jgi:hypothetical protein
LILALPDLILGGKRSAVSRYLISCFPGVQLAVAYLLASHLKTQQRFWQVVFAGIFTASIASCTLSAVSDTSWSKDLSYFNAEVAKNINKEAIANRSIKDTIVISDRGNDFTNTKYLDDSSTLLIPAPLNDTEQADVRRLALAAFRAVDGAGMSRVDFLMSRDTGDLFVNEVNTIPGFTTISMYPKMWEASGLPYPALLDRLIALALERHAERQRLRTSIT